MANTTGSTSSSMTSTSHTLTHDPLSRTAPKPGSTTTKTNSIVGMEYLSKALEPSNRHAFIQPSVEICEAAIEAAKSILDGVAGGVCDGQAARLQARKRKRGDGDQGGGLRIRKVHTEGFGVEQVWEQARRVIDALRGEVEMELELEQFEGATEAADEGEEDESGRMNGLVKTVRFDEDGFEIGSGDESLEDEADDGLEDEEDIEMGGGKEEDDMGSVDEDEEAGAEMDELPDMEGDEDYQDDCDDEDEPADVFVEDPHGLNDGFFSIDDFNKQTEFLEQQDAAADPYAGEASDEEEIDWDEDPMSIPAASISSSRRATAMDVEDEDEEEDDDEDGPTFGNADLNAADDDSDQDEDAHLNEGINEGVDNTNDILYKDFFEPPPRKVGKGERQANFLARQARKSKQPYEEDAEAEIERAIANVRRDLLDDDSEHEDSGDALSNADASEPKSRKSAHERRQAKLAEEIRKLEAASVAKREWTLSGEARAADRPLNSLLEEDLDFERTGKPVPVITADVSESIEELIKRRILAQEFDEVIRRRPDSESLPSNVRRGAFELDDSKPQQSLAEIYEEEHIKATNPDTYMSKADDKLKKQHQEIELLWKDVSAKLDALSSWHYKPKPPAPSLSVVADVATVSMEDAQPTTASGMAGGESMLAPQEIYKAGKDKHAIEKGEVVPKSGIPVARQEMTREQKLRRRRREKERIKKRGGAELNKRPEGKKTKEKRETVEELKKGGVKVIGRKGDIRDVDGNKLKAAPTTNGAGGFNNRRNISASPSKPKPRVSNGIPFPQACAHHITNTFHASRVYIIASASISETDNFKHLQDALGDKVVGVRYGIEPHTPLDDVLEIVTDMRQKDADLIVALGAGSLTDGAKLISWALANDAHALDDLAKLDAAAGAQSLKPCQIPIIKIPTSLSGGEYSLGADATDTRDRHKVNFTHPSMGAELIILDPALSILTPAWIWLSTGMRAVDHCVEGLCSLDHCVTDETDGHAAKGLSMLVPSLLETKRDWEAEGPQLAEMMGVIEGEEMVAKVLTERGLEKGKANAGDVLDAVIRELGMPHTLNEVRVIREQLDALAVNCLKDRWLKTNPVPLTTKEQVLEILEMAVGDEKE